MAQNSDLEQTVTIHEDDQTRYLYATDASMYQEVPKGATYPKTGKDIQQIVRQAGEQGFSITARSGGTSLAGQATGSRDSVIMDVSRHMTKILEINPKNRYAHVQPGVIRDTLNRAAAPHKLQFGPDTSTTNRCMLGGMIGNNSTGSFSIKHGSTRDHILEIEAVLSDGSTAVFKPLTPDELEAKKQLDSLEGYIYRGMLKLIEENRERILEAYPHPEIIRRNTGYALDKLCTMQPFDPDGRKFNMAELLCGSEGTLAMTVSAKVDLSPLDDHRILLIPQFKNLRDALEATVEAVKHDPAAVELVDDIILDATKGNIEQRKNRFFLDGDPACILIIQFEGNDKEKLANRAEKLSEIFTAKGYGYAAPVIKNEDKIDHVWDLRKAGLGLLMGLGADSRSPTFVEDTAVRVQDLPEYVDQFKKIMDKYDTRCVFYAHASVGELHLRPVLDTHTKEGLQTMKNMAEEVADLVHSFNGSLSGEHGDGRARAPFIEKVLGPEMMPLLRKVKELWDPKYIFNPGKIVNPKPMDSDLRFSPSYKRAEVDTVFKWRKEGSFADALELCNGAGVCRKLAQSGGTMCPSYMATKEEKDSTRGRANLFRQLFSGRQKEAFTSAELRDALDLCLSCKACKSECPANVDMARMKAEFLQGWHEEKGVSLSYRFFGQASKIYPLASSFAPMVNWFNKTPVAKELLDEFLNIHKERDLPEFAREPFSKWWKKRTKISHAENRLKVVLFVDIFSNYHEPRIAKAAVNVLEKMGYQVLVPDFHESGRPQLSKGLLEEAQALAQTNIPSLYSFAKDDIPIVGLEPSEILTFRDEYLDLCEDELLKQAEKVATLSYQFEEFLLKHQEDKGNATELFKGNHQNVQVHGHCHTKALTGVEPTLRALELAGYEVEDLETGCCGMAGSFGYEADHYEISMDIGELRLFPALRSSSSNKLVCASGFSCRHQIKDGTNREAYHLVELLERALQD